MDNLLSMFGFGNDEQQIDGWTGSGQEPEKVNPIASARRKASDYNNISNVGKGSGEPSLIAQFVEDVKAGKGWREGLNKKPIVSKQSSKTESKKQNQVEMPDESLIPKPKKASKPTQDTSGRSEYVTLDTPEKVAQATAETQGEIVEAADDKSMWESALEQLGYGVDVAKKVWDEIPSTGDRVDWLTTLTVYAASRYMGNNGGLALANGLMRGMESQAKKNQLKRAMEQGQAQAEAAAVQQGIENRFKDREISAKEKTAEANLLTAQNKANGGGDLLNKYSPEKVRDSVKETLTNLGAIKEGLIFGNSDSQNELILSRIENKVVEKIRNGDTRSPSEIATEEVKRLAAEQKK